MKAFRLFLLCGALALSFTNGMRSAVFTAVADGEWSSSATWGLAAPGFEITGADEIIIAPSIDVTLDGDLTIDNLMATLNVQGSLSGNHNIDINRGSITGLGSLNLDSLRFGTGASSLFLGTITVDNFENNSVLFGLTSALNVNSGLVLRGGLFQLNLGGVVNLSDDATITLGGGNVALNGGLINAAGNLNLRYAGNMGIIGPETSIQGITNISVDMDADTAKVNASSDLVFNTALNLQRGSLRLNGFDLTINGTIDADGGTIISDGESDITINGMADIGTLVFAEEGNTVNNLSLTIGQNGNIDLGSSLTVQGNLNLNSGSLDISGQDLTLNGGINVNGTGSINTNLGSGITINGSGDNFLLGLDGENSALGRLTLNMDNNGSVALTGNLRIEEMLALNEGTLLLDGMDLTINGQVMTSNTAGITSSILSDIVLTGGAGNTLRFNAGGNTVSSFTLNLQSGGDATLLSDLNIENDLDINSGILQLNENSLTINGMLDVSANGSIGSDANSDITLNGNGGVLRLSESSTLLGNLTLNLTENSTLTAQSDLMTYGNFALNGGILDLNGFDLTTNGMVNILSTGELMASEGSSIRVNGTGLVGNLAIGGEGNAVNDLTINIAGGGSIMLDSDIRVDGNLALNDGMLRLNGRNLTVNGIIDASGAGSLAGDVESALNINGSGSAGIIEFAEEGNILGNLGIDLESDGNVNLGSDLIISNLLTLMNGRINLHDFDLILDDNAVIENAGPGNYIITSGSGTLQMDVNAGGSGTLFPVGTQTAYLPVTLTNGAVSSTGRFMVRTAADVLENGTTGNDLSQIRSVVDATWFVDSDVSSDLDLTMETAWNAMAEVNDFNRMDAYISHYTEGAWDERVGAQATTGANGYFSLSRSGITSLSPFAVFEAEGSSVAFEEHPGLLIYPNPVQNILFVNPEIAIDLNNVKIFDILGNEVIDKNMPDVNEVYSGMDVQFLLPGVYYLTVNNQYVGKFSKE